MATIGWNNVGRSSNSGNGDNKVNWLKIFAGGEVIVRPVGEPKELNKYFVKLHPADKGRGAITDGGKNCVILKKYVGEDGKPLYRQQTKYAFNVIDRADGQLKVLEVARSVALDIRDWGEENNANPGGPKGCDWKIKSVKTGPDARDVEYKLFNRDRTPFSEEENKLIENVYDLDKIFPVTPQDQLEERLGLVPAKEPAASSSTPATSPTKTASPTKAATPSEAEEELSF